MQSSGKPIADSKLEEQRLKSLVAKSTVGESPFEAARSVASDRTFTTAVSMSAMYAGARPMDDLWTSKHNL